MFLESDIYSPAGTTYQITTADLTQHRTWQTALNAKLPAGSNYFLEIAHNGNGNIEVLCPETVYFEEPTLLTSVGRR